jgi:hypothetical protein
LGRQPGNNWRSTLLMRAMIDNFWAEVQRLQHYNDLYDLRESEAALGVPRLPFIRNFDPLPESMTDASNRLRFPESGP